MNMFRPLDPSPVGRCQGGGAFCGVAAAGDRPLQRRRELNGELSGRGVDDSDLRIGGVGCWVVWVFQNLVLITWTRGPCKPKPASAGGRVGGREEGTPWRTARVRESASPQVWTPRKREAWVQINYLFSDLFGIQPTKLWRVI